MDASPETNVSQQKDGEIVMEALQHLVEPVTFTDIVNHISNKQKVLISAIKEPVKSVLERGVQLGFIKKYGGRYATDATGSHICFGSSKSSRRRLRSRPRRSRSRSHSRSRSRPRRRSRTR